MNNVTHNETSITTPTDTEILVERIVDAPREVVWKAYTDPELIAQWLGPRNRTMTVEEMDVRQGGRYRFIHSLGDDHFTFYGEYRAIEKPSAIEWTFNYDGAPSEQVDRTEFEELDGGRTRIVSTSTFVSKDDRDRMLGSGMDRGMRESFERLDELVATRQS